MIKKTILLTLVCLLTGQLTYSQDIFIGKLDFSAKTKLLSLLSTDDSLSISFDERRIIFTEDEETLLIKIKNNQYNLVHNSIVIQLKESRKNIVFSNGLSFDILTKTAHTIVLTDKEGNIVLDAKYNLQGALANYNIEILDKKHETILLTYATKYLYELSLNEVNTTPNLLNMY